MVNMPFSFNEEPIAGLDPGFTWFPPGLIACSTFFDHILREGSDRNLHKDPLEIMRT